MIRFNLDGYTEPHPDGEYIYYSDHEAAIAAAVAAEREACARICELYSGMEHFWYAEKIRARVPHMTDAIAGKK